VEIEGFNEIAGIILLAKELHDIERYDIVEKYFFDTLCYDSWHESMYGVITSLFSGFNSDYDDGDEEEKMTFTDDIISEYFVYAWEFGEKTNTPHDENPYVKGAEFEARRWLNFTYNMDWRLLGCAKTREDARESRLIVRTCACDFDEHEDLAHGLVQLYQFFTDKCAEFRERTKTEEVMIV